MSFLPSVAIPSKLPDKVAKGLNGIRNSRSQKTEDITSCCNSDCVLLASFPIQDKMTSLLRFTRRSLSNGQLAKAQARQQAVQTVKQAAETSFNFVYVGGSLVLTGAVVYSITNVLFSPSSPYRVRDKSFDQIRLHEEAINALGEPMKAFGEGARRRGHLVSSEQIINGEKHVKIQYHISGPKSQGDVFAEAKPKGWFRGLDFNYIVVNCPRRKPIYVLDNREQERQ